MGARTISIAKMMDTIDCVNFFDNDVIVICFLLTLLQTACN